jgi:sugar lactone lactonase YvrE
MNITIDKPLIPLRLDVGEGPVWDATTSSLLFVDVTPGRIYRYSMADAKLLHADFGQEVGAAIPSSEGGLVVAARDGIYQTDANGQRPALIAAIESNNPGNRMNDAKVDPLGRLWAGTMAFDFAEGAAALYRVDGTSYVRVLSGLTIANGLDWSLDATQMYFIDSGTYAVDILDFDLASGELGNRRTLVPGRPEAGMPDGLTVDNEGHFWVAYFGAGEVRRFSPTGTLSGSVKLPVSQVTSCCFGGDDLSTLFITTAAYKLTPEQLASEPFSGSVFACKPGIQGRASNTFKVSE